MAWMNCEEKKWENHFAFLREESARYPRAIFHVRERRAVQIAVERAISQGRSYVERCDTGGCSYYGSDKVEVMTEFPNVLLRRRFTDGIRKERCTPWNCDVSFGLRTAEAERQS